MNLVGFADPRTALSGLPGASGSNFMVALRNSGSFSILERSGGSTTIFSEYQIVPVTIIGQCRFLY